MHIQGQSRDQGTLFPERLDELVAEDNAVRVIDAFVDSLDVKALGFVRIEVQATGRPPYHPSDLLKRCQAHGMTPYLPVQRAMNNQRDGSYFDKRRFRYDAAGHHFTCRAGERLAKKTKSTASRHHLYATKACGGCGIKSQCTAGMQRWVTRHFDEDVLNAVAERTTANPLMMRRRSGMVEHPFGTLKRRMDGGRFLLRGLTKVKAEMARAVTAYDITRAINVLGTKRLCQALAV